MPLLVTPRQLTQRGEFYHQLAVLTAAGVGIRSALETLRTNPPGPGFRQPIASMIQRLDQGASFTESVQGGGPAWLPSFDLALVQAGEQSGRLDMCLRLLANYYHDRARLARRVLSDLAYPAFILHLAILIFPAQMLTRLVWEGAVVEFVLAKGAIFLTIYAIVGIVAFLGQAQRNHVWRAALERLLHRIPVLGTARTNLALARLTAALESLLTAGVSVIEAWPLAAAASGSPALVRTVRAWAPMVNAGQTPAEAVRESGSFPELFANLYGTGELTGQLDETLRRLHQHYQEEAFRKLELLAQWTPRLIYFLIVLAIAYQIVAFWSGYFSQIGQLTGE